MLSNTCKYAIRAIIFISVHRNENFVGIKKISEQLGIPSPFLGKILQSLAKKKLLISSKGPHGGFNLAKEPEQITLYNIVNLVDGDDLFTNCLISFRSCADDKKYCALHDSYQSIRKSIKDLFVKITIADLQANVENSSVHMIL